MAQKTNTILWTVSSSVGRGPDSGSSSPPFGPRKAHEPVVQRAALGGQPQLLDLAKESGSYYGVAVFPQRHLPALGLRTCTDLLCSLLSSPCLQPIEVVL